MSCITSTQLVLAPGLLKHQGVEMAWAGAAIERTFLKLWLNFKKRQWYGFSPSPREHPCPVQVSCMHTSDTWLCPFRLCDFFLSWRSYQGSFLHQLVAFSFSFALPNIFHIWISDFCFLLFSCQALSRGSQSCSLFPAAL